MLLLFEKESIDNKIDEANENEYFTITLYQMDIDRIRFSLIKYLKIRLLKIESQIDHLMEHYDMMDRLSGAEKHYITQIHNLNNTYFEENVITRLTTEAHQKYFRKNEDRMKHATPNLEVSLLMRRFHF